MQNQYTMLSDMYNLKIIHYRIQKYKNSYNRGFILTILQNSATHKTIYNDSEINIYIKLQEKVNTILNHYSCKNIDNKIIKNKQMHK